MISGREFVPNVSTEGLLIYSIQGMPAGWEFKVKVFSFNGFEFDELQIETKIVWKGFHLEGN